MGFEPSECNSPVDCCSSPARRGRLLTILSHRERIGTESLIHPAAVRYAPCSDRRIVSGVDNGIRRERHTRRVGKKVSGGHFFSSGENPWEDDGTPDGVLASSHFLSYQGDISDGCKQLIFRPFTGIALNIIPYFPIIIFVTDHMIIETFLPNRKTCLFGHGSFHHPDHR